MSVDGLFSRLNPLVAWILRSPLHPLLSPGLLLLTFRGRTSGRRFTIPVGYQREGDSVTVMVSEAGKKQWWRNYREPGPVSLRLRGRELLGEAVVVSPGSDEFRTRAEATLARMPWLGRTFGIAYDKRVGLTDEQVATLGREIAVVHIALAPGAGPAPAHRPGGGG